MDRRDWLLSSLVAGSMSLCGCKSAPMTGRKQLMLVPETEEVALGKQAFANVLSEHEGATSSKYNAIVERVGMKIAAASGRQDYEWETRVVASAEQNAFCLPGGKIVVYEGIIPICENEAGLAVVMGHEVAHVLARHGGERMSQQTAVNGAKTAVSYVLQNKEQGAQDLWLKAYGMATTYGVVLPYSRKHELEADHIGLMLMAEAGYDPAEAPKFWTRFGAASKGPNQPGFLSTHPTDSRSASELESLLPKAFDNYRQAPNPVGAGQLIV